ncbi:unnamed protein product [Prorocentrum cordatum]|uniref:Uncharacterized protein n=1 Tax=Prorocentrum cordatum TaxID=2364126 RepID=A0ABN9RWG4_9DINO|nr:unnamed protein product [Polarella glacialis]
MVRSATATACVLAVCCAVLRGTRAFLPAPQGLRGEAVAAASVLALGAADPAHAFTYNGKEYFDVFYGISPLAWGFCAFCIVFYGAVLKNAALKYNTPYGTTTDPNAKPIKTGGFKGKEAENSEPALNVLINK